MQHGRLLGLIARRFGDEKASLHDLHDVADQWVLYLARYITISPKNR
jgi:hypothetical protein